jgi:hypothetical protein
MINADPNVFGRGDEGEGSGKREWSEGGQKVKGKGKERREGRGDEETRRLPNFWEPTPNFFPQGKLALVLGAGNQASIGVADAIYKLINCNEVVFLKHNPVNEYLFPIYEKVRREGEEGKKGEEMEGGDKNEERERKRTMKEALDSLSLRWKREGRRRRGEGRMEGFNSHLHVDDEEFYQSRIFPTLQG